MRFRGVLLALWPAAAAGQTRFEWPDTTVDVARYATVEYCLAALTRIRDGVDRTRALTIWQDTMPNDPGKALAPAPALVTDAATRCAARFAEPAVDLHDFAPMLELYLAAGRDSDAAALVARRLSAAAPTNAHERTVIADSAVMIYLAARPARLAAAEAILIPRARGSADRVERLKTYGDLLKASTFAGDTARARRIARWMIGVADSLTAAERQSEQFEMLGDGTGGDGLIYEAVAALTSLETLLDSLRKSTAALVSLERGTWARALGARAEAFPLPIGQRAPAITADYWLPSSAGNAPHPVRGRVTLVVFLSQASCISQGATDDVAFTCATRLAELRRFARRFPALDITIVMSTTGAFMYAVPPSPAEEAELLRHMLDPYEVPGAVLGVSSTPFWRLPEPDGRRINKEVPNAGRYNFGKIWNPGVASLMLIDADGIIADLAHSREDELTSFIDVLLHREGMGRGP